MTDTKALALVTGFAVHGLAVARALRKAGVDVHALTQLGSRFSPTRFTRYAHVHVRDNLNSEALVGHLVELASGLDATRPIVLFPTSDRMAAAMAGGWDQLCERYRLSWAHCRDLIVSMQLKDNLPELAARCGILHPRSVRIGSDEDCALAATQLRLPCIVKPVKPLSAFKALIVGSLDELRALTRLHQSELPFIAQELIDGDEGSLYACTTFLDHGRELCMFTSRKLAASPPGLGQGTIFTSEPNPEIEELTRRFVHGLDLSGPVALEFKRDRVGKYWMIEPNVGRTEYCVDLAIQAGVNLPWIEYCHATGQATDPRSCLQREQRVWFDTDKDAFCYLRSFRRLYGGAQKAGAPIFPFAGTGDWAPLFVSTAQQALALAKDLVRPRA